jgi:tRNA dimethylallyltransferase
MERKIICIVGPTASGKTGWGVKISRKWGGEIISADSRQVYKKLDIGTGKDLKEYGEIKYHLIDICRPGEHFTMFDWLEKARVVIDDIFSRGKTPIIVGGTGLYVQSLIEGFMLGKSEIRNPNVERYKREELEKKSIKELQKIIFKLKIENFKLDLNNPHRLIRAIERAQSGEITTKKKPDFEALQIAIDLPRDVLYQRIDQRVEEWFEQGFVEEVQSLIDAKVKPDWLEKIGLEYRTLAKYLICHFDSTKSVEKSFKRSFGFAQDDKNKNHGDNEFEDMKQQMKFAIHAFARRQLTWFRRFPEVVWFRDLKSAEKAIEKILI